MSSNTNANDPESSPTAQTGGPDAGSAAEDSSASSAQTAGVPSENSAAESGAEESTTPADHDTAPAPEPDDAGGDTPEQAGQQEEDAADQQNGAGSDSANQPAQGAGAASQEDSVGDEDEELSQKSRALRIKSAVDENLLLVTRMAGVEGISRPFLFELDLLSLHDDVEFDKLLGASATITAEIPNMPARTWHGVITSFSQTAKDDNYTYYSATLEPAIFALRLRTNCRVFQDKKVDEILETVLEGFDIKQTYSRADDRQPRNYCVQYRETDFAFFSRLIEEYGLMYYFEHSADGHTLVLCDDSTQLSKTPGLSPVDYCAINEGDSTVKTWVKTQRLVASGVSLRDTHFQIPAERFESQDSIAESATLGSVAHTLNPGSATNTLYDYPAGYAARYDSVGKLEPAPSDDDFDSSPIKNIAADAKTEARLRCELLANQAITVSAASDVLQLTPGGVFTLNGHYNADGDYLVTQIKHTVRLGLGVTSAGVDDSLEYGNDFTCFPSSLPYRTPRTTPRPVVHGLQTARVVADHSSKEPDVSNRRELLIDKYGRVKVWFPWDQRPEPPAEEAEPQDAAAQSDQPSGDATADGDGQQLETAGPADRSCWIRVAQFWAGKGWGSFFWPRHGHEVLVAFEHGDPDKPIIVGSVYNRVNMPPKELPKEHMLAGIKSCTINEPEPRHFNGVTFFDQKDGEHLDLHSEAHTITVTEESQHNIVKGTCVRVFGTMGRKIGSGAGGGPGVDANLTGFDAALSRNYPDLFTQKGYEADINVVLGNSAAIVGGFPAGTLNEVVQGGKLEICIDPMGWLDDGLIKTLQNLAMPTGQWSALFGVGRELHYGHQTEIRHGSSISRRTHKALDSANPLTHMVGAIIAASSGLTLLGWKQQSQNPLVWENLVRALGPRGASGRLLSLLIELEKAYGETDTGTEKQCEASSLSDQADALKSDYAALLLQLAGAVTDQGAALIASGQQDSADEQEQANSEDNSVDDAEKAGEESEADASGDSGGDEEGSAEQDSDDDPPDPEGPDEDNISFGDDASDVYECYDGLLATTARHVTFRARAADEDDSEPSLIHLDAQGADGEDNGVVAINSTGQATVVCGPASVQVRRDAQTGQVDISAGNEGTITLSVGPAGSGSLITMTSDGIKLSVGPDGGPCLELTTSGVTMSCGSNSVAVDQSGQTTSGMNITHKADMAFDAEGTMVTLKGSAQATVKGAITMIN